MGRGLSELQRSILRLALHNRTADGLEPLKYLVIIAGPSHYVLGTAEDNAPFLAHSDRLKAEGFDILYYRGLKARAVLHETATRDDASPLADRARASGFDACVTTDSIEQADVYVWEVLHSFYGFETAVEARYPLAPPGLWLPYDLIAGKRRKGDDPMFSKAAIGEAKYNASHVAVRKAFVRLHERGLVECFRWGKGGASGLKLTTKGVEEAERLSAKQSDVITTISQ